MAAYADEVFYQDSYLMGRKPVIRTGFSYYAREASRVIDRYTFTRLKKRSVIPEEVKLCCCELAELRYSQEKHKQESGGKSSESVGTYSVSFASNTEISQAESVQTRAILNKWLGDTDLLYQGV